MKRFVLIILAIILVVSVSSPVFAQTETQSGDYTLETQIDENTTQATNKYFDLTLTQELQSPLNKDIIYTLTVIPHLDSSKVQMTWTASSSSITINPRVNDFVSMTDGETYTYRATIKPTLAGTFTVSVSVVAWQYDTNYTNSVEDTITLNNMLVAQPVGTPYILLSALEALIIVGIIVFVILEIRHLAPKYTKKAKEWLTPPN